MVLNVSLSVLCREGIPNWYSNTCGHEHIHGLLLPGAHCCQKMQQMPTHVTTGNFRLNTPFAQLLPTHDTYLTLLPLQTFHCGTRRFCHLLSGWRYFPSAAVAGDSRSVTSYTVPLRTFHIVHTAQRWLVDAFRQQQTPAVSPAAEAVNSTLFSPHLITWPKFERSLRWFLENRSQYAPMKYLARWIQTGSPFFATWCFRHMEKFDLQGSSVHSQRHI